MSASFTWNVERIPEAGCWIWMGAEAGTGYGQFGRCSTAHRAAFEAAHGPIPKGLNVCHHCDVKLCVNPDHLFLGTTLENQTDMLRKGRAVSNSGRPIRPITDELIAQILAEKVVKHSKRRQSYRAIGMRYGVSDNFVRKLFRERGLKCDSGICECKVPA